MLLNAGREVPPGAWVGGLSTHPLFPSCDWQLSGLHLAPEASGDSPGVVWREWPGATQIASVIGLREMGGHSQGQLLGLAASVSVPGVASGNLSVTSRHLLSIYCEPAAVIDK